MPTIELAEKAVKYGRKNNIPTVVDIRDLWPDIYNEILPRKIGFLIKPYVWYSRRRLKKLLNGATAITSLSSSFLNWGLNYADRGGTIYDRVFYMGYKKCEYSQDNNFGEWSTYNLNSDDFIVCFFGTLGRQFCYEPIINAAKQLLYDKNIKFIICGDGEFLTMLKEQAHHLPNIIFTGWINEKQIQQLLSIAAVGLAPYRDSINFTRNIPNKFAEYLSAAMPVLLGIEGEMANLVGNYGCGYVYKTGNQLAEYIFKLKTEPNLRKSMSKNACELFNECFDAEMVYSNMVTYLEEVLETSSTGGNYKRQIEKQG
jgi:glycosyltransferase involved in cell wall biosynthesis